MCYRLLGKEVQMLRTHTNHPDFAFSVGPFKVPLFMVCLFVKGSYQYFLLTACSVLDVVGALPRLVFALCSESLPIQDRAVQGRDLPFFAIEDGAVRWILLSAPASHRQGPQDIRRVPYRRDR